MRVQLSTRSALRAEAERDPDAEAWIFIALGLLTMADRVLDGVMQESWPSIRESRVRWMTGRTLD